MRRRYCMNLLAVVLICCWTAVTFALEVPLKYEKASMPMRKFFPYGYQQIEKLPGKPEGVWKLPELKSKKPVYCFIQLGSQKRLAILDQKHADDAFYNCIYFDSNGNNDLTDDPLIEVQDENHSQNYSQAMFAAADIKVKEGNQDLPYSFSVRAIAFSQNQADTNYERNLNLMCQVSCYYSGAFDLDGKHYRLALGDSNCDGRFCDIGSTVQTIQNQQRMLYPKGDSFYLAMDKEIDYYDKQPLGNRLLIGQKMYDVAINIPQGKMTLTETQDKLVPLLLAANPDKMTLRSEDGKFCLMLIQPENKIMVPAGRYQLLDYQILRQDEQGDQWRLSATGTQDCPFITVDSMSTAKLLLGEPLTASANLPEYFSRMVTRGSLPNQVPLSLDIRGAGRETVADLSHVSGNSTKYPLSSKTSVRPQEPTFKIVTGDGELVAQGQFEYG